MLFLFWTKGKDYDSRLSVWSVCEVTSDVVQSVLVPPWGEGAGKLCQGCPPLPQPPPLSFPVGRKGEGQNAS